MGYEPRGRRKKITSAFSPYKLSNGGRKTSSRSTGASSSHGAFLQAVDKRQQQTDLRMGPPHTVCWPNKVTNVDRSFPGGDTKREMGSINYVDYGQYRISSIPIGSNGNYSFNQKNECLVCPVHKPARSISPTTSSGHASGSSIHRAPYPLPYNRIEGAIPSKGLLGVFQSPGEIYQPRVRDFPRYPDTRKPFSQKGGFGTLDGGTRRGDRRQPIRIEASPASAQGGGGGLRSYIYTFPGEERKRDSVGFRPYNIIRGRPSANYQKSFLSTSSNYSTSESRSEREQSAVEAEWLPPPVLPLDIDAPNLPDIRFGTCPVCEKTNDIDCECTELFRKDAREEEFEKARNSEDEGGCRICEHLFCVCS
jgi:hypothetical protein